MIIDDIYQHVILPALSYIEHLFFGKARQALFDQENFIKNELTPAAQKSENGVNIVRVGPPLLFSTRHIALVVPKSKAAIVELTDKGIENDPSGRSIMNPFESLLGGPSITNMTGPAAMAQLGKIRRFTSDVHGFKTLEKQKFKDALSNWQTRKEGFVLLDEIKLLIRGITYNRFISKERDFTSDGNSQVNAAFSGLKKVLLDPYSLSTQISFASTAMQYRENSRKFVEAHTNEITDARNQKGVNIIADISSDDIQNANNDEEIKKTITEKLGGSLLLMGSLDGVYINLVGILFQLMKSPAVVDRLRVELDNACNKTDNAFTIDDEVLADATKLPYLDCIVKEGLRYVSSAPILPRYTENGIHTEHMDIPPHSTILINLEAMHYDEELWGKDAHEFKPERFLKNDAPKLQEYPFMPFAIGKRQCPGIKVGLMSLKLFISELYLNYDLVAGLGQPEPTVDKTAALVMDIGPGYKVHLQSRYVVASHPRNLKSMK